MTDGQAEDGDWWDCPVCGEDTTTDTGPETDRECTSCDWSVSIPKAGDLS